MDYFPLSLLVTIASVTFAFWCCLRIKRPRRAFFSALLVLLCADQLAEIFGGCTAAQGIRNTLFYNVFIFLEFLLVLRLLMTLWPGSKWAVATTALLGMGGWAWSWSRWQSLDFLLTEGIAIASLLLTIWIVVLLWRLSEESRTPLAKVPEFWVLTALLVFYGALFPIIGPLRLLYEGSPQLAKYLYTIIQVLSLVRYGLIGYACILEARKRPSL